MNEIARGPGTHKIEGTNTPEIEMYLNQHQEKNPTKKQKPNNTPQPQPQQQHPNTKTLLSKYYSVFITA